MYRRNYKGDEPSPKGLGYCAHAEEVGTIRLGKDTRAYVVKQSKNTNKRWVKLGINKENYSFK